MTTERSAGVTGRLLREVCGLFVTGVTVVTSVADGRPIGTTVNSFTSVSLEPPLVLFCLHRQSRLRRGLAESRRFAVNFLTGRQEQLAWSFATKHTGIVPPDAYGDCAVGMPVLNESLAFIACTITEEFEGGDHTIVVGEVVELGSPRRGHEPLIFHRGTLSALEDRLWSAQPIWDG